jgi:hypothetical protein
MKCFEVSDHTADIGLIVPETPGGMAGQVKSDSQGPYPTCRIHHGSFLSSSHEPRWPLSRHLGSPFSFISIVNPHYAKLISGLDL